VAKRVLAVLAALVLCAVLPVPGTRAAVSPASLGLRFSRPEGSYPDPAATSFRLAGTLPASFPVRVDGSRLVAAPGSLPAGKTAAVYAAGGDYPLQYLGHGRVADDGSLSLDLVRFVDGQPWGGGDVWVVLSGIDLPVNRAVNGDFSAGTQGWDGSQYYPLGVVESGVAKLTDETSFVQRLSWSGGEARNLEVLAKRRYVDGHAKMFVDVAENASVYWSWGTSYLDDYSTNLESVPGLSRGHRDVGGGWREFWVRVPARPDLSRLSVRALQEYGTSYFDDCRVFDYGAPGWRSPAPAGWQVYAFDGQDFEVPDTAVDDSPKYDWYRMNAGLLGIRNGAMMFQYGNYWYRCARTVSVVPGGRVRLTCGVYAAASSALYLEWLNDAGAVVASSLVGQTAYAGPQAVVQLEREYPVPAGASRVRLAFNVISDSARAYLDYWWIESLAPSP